VAKRKCEYLVILKQYENPNCLDLIKVVIDTPLEWVSTLGELEGVDFASIDNSTVYLYIDSRYDVLELSAEVKELLAAYHKPVGDVWQGEFQEKL